MINPIIFREYDIRGIVDSDFNQDFAYQLGRAFCEYIYSLGQSPPLQITVGHDARLSSPLLTKHLEKGLSDSGAKVLHLGLITTPISYYSTFALENIDGSIMVTGSHNPPNYNGFKISVGQSTLFGKNIQDLRDIIEKNQYTSQPKGSIQPFNIFPHYIKRYTEEFQYIDPIPVVFDCGNGTAGCILRQLCESIGLKPHILFEKPDGTFPNHHPDPTVESNLISLRKKVKDCKAMIGIGFDGDADRIGVVDNHGRMILGDELIILFSRDILSKTPGQHIVGDVKCSDKMYADIKKHNGQPLMWKTGHSLIKQKIKDISAPLGGELSGHIFFSDRNYGYDDAIYAGMRLIEIVSKTKKSIGELLSDLPHSFSTPEIRIQTEEEKTSSIVKQLIQKYSNSSPAYKVNLMDGVRISFKNGWALARASNTQPVIVLRFEADTQENLEKIRREIEDFVKERL